MQNQIETDTATSSARQRQLLQHLQQHRFLLQRQQQQLYNLLPPISQSRLLRDFELPPIPVKLSRYSTGEDLDPPSVASSVSPTSLSRSLPDGWLNRQQQQQHQYDPELPQSEREDDYSMSYDRDEKSSNEASGSTLPPPKGMDDDMPSTSDFVKKLYRMLEDPSFQSVVCWGPMGDCFVVKDMNECTKSVLPRMFKHSNFASFVRQLNKYDFHKVKSTENNPYGEHSWTFRHPDFHAERPEALENIKRKPPAQRKAAALAASVPAPAHVPEPAPSPAPVPGALRQSTSYSSSVDKEPRNFRDSSLDFHENLGPEIRPLKVENEDLKERIANLERNYEHVLQEMVGFQQGMAQQDGLMHSLITYFVKSEGAKRQSPTSANGSTSYSDLNSNLQSLLSHSSSASAPSVQSPGLGFGQGSTSNSTRSPEPPSKIPPTSRQLLQKQLQAHLGQHRALSFSETQLQSSSLAAEEARTVRDVGSLYSEPLRDSQSQSGYLNNALSSSPSEQAQYNSSRNDGLANDHAFPQTERDSSSRQAMLSDYQPQHQQPPLAYSISPNSMPQTSPREGQNPSHPFSGSPSAGSGHDREGSARAQQPSSPNNTWDKTWETMIASPFNLASLPGFDAGLAETALNDEGLQLYTVGHLLPRSGQNDGSSSSSSYSRSAEESAQRNGNIRMPAGTSSSSGDGDQSNPSFDNEMQTSLEETVQPTKSNSMDSFSTSESSSSGGVVTASERQKLRVRRTTFVPSWAVPPHVLLVDDDAVSRRLSSKFLEVFGCTIDVAVDGISAVNKMNLEKYDLVLMDIVMPKLDGVSATNLIRKFDKGTPIISMTGNSNPNQIMSYFSSGMNDILAKPFTKKGLLDVLEKHLVHLKVIHHMAKLPRSIGVPPLSDSNFEHALTTSANNLFMLQQQQQQQSGGSLSRALTPSFGSLESSINNPDGMVSAPSPFNFPLFGESSNEAQINPFAGMGISDDHYKMLMQNIVNGDGFPGVVQSMASPSSPWGSESTAVWSSGLTEKRPLDNPEDEREEKRSRFEVIE